MLNLWLKHGHLDTLAYILIPQAPIQPSRFPAWLVRFRAVHLVQLSLYWQTQSIIQAWGTLFTADPSMFYVSKATSPWVTSIHGSLFYGSIFSQQWSHTWTRRKKRMLHFILELKLSNSRLSLRLASLRAVYDSHLAFGKIKGLNTNIFSTSDTESFPNIWLHPTAFLPAPTHF